MNVNTTTSNTNNLLITPKGLTRHGPKVWIKDQPPWVLERIFPMVVVGKFIDERSFSERRVQGWIQSRWRKNGSIVVEKVGSVFMLHCSDIRDRDNLVDLESASLNGALFVMAPWYPQASAQSFTFEYACLWVRVEGLPLHASSLESVKTILNDVGRVIYFDEESLKPGTKEYIRVKIRIPLKLSLLPGFYFEAIDGEFVWVYLRYENVFILCHKCGRIGHESDGCRVTVGDMQNLLGKRMGMIAKNQENVMIEEFHKDMFTSKLIGLKRSDIYKNSAINLVNYHRWTPERVIRRKKTYPLSSDSSSSSEGSDSISKTHRKRKVREPTCDVLPDKFWEKFEAPDNCTKKIRINVPIYIRRGVPTVAPITIDKGESSDSIEKEVQFRVKKGGNPSTSAEHSPII